MSNNDNLLEQLIIYEDLTKSNELLNKELLSLSGKNDTDSINRINEIGRLLNENNNKISSYDKDKLDKVTKYFSSEREFRRLSNEIKAFENLSKKGEEDRVEVRSAEGRPKKIYKSLAEEYQKLTEQKASMKNSFLKEYKDIEKFTSIINEPTLSNTTTKTQEEVKNTMPEVQEEKTLPEIKEKDYKNFTVEEKRQHLESKIETIIASSFLPNMGKKSQIMYNGKRYNIPKAYRGEFLNLTARLNALNKREAGKGIGENKETIKEAVQETKKEMSNKGLENTIYDAKTIIMPQKPKEKETPKERFERTLEEIYGKDTIILPERKEEPLVEEENPYMFGHYQHMSKPKTSPIEYEDNPYMFGHYNPMPRKMTLPDLIDLCNKNKIELHPIPVTFKNSHKVNFKKAMTTVKKKLSLSNFKKLLPKAFNIDKRVELTFVNMHEKLAKKGLKIKQNYVHFKEGTIQKYNSVKNTVTSIPKRTKDYIKGKYDGFKKYFADKKEISRLRSEDGYTRKEAMEEVYGDKKDKHLDYRIVNRATKFKDNTCQRIKTTTSKIVETTKAVADTIAKPFRWLRDNYHNEVKRAELQGQIDEAKARTEAIVAARKRVKTNPNTGGYVGTIVITVMGVLVLAGIIFMGIGSLINR